jgi:hypothetical protein
MGAGGLDDRTIEVRSPAEQEICLKPLVSRPALGPTQPPVQWVPGVLSPGKKIGRDVTLTTYPHLMPRSGMSRTYTSSHPCASIGVLWDCFTYKQHNIQYTALRNCVEACNTGLCIRFTSAVLWTVPFSEIQVCMLQAYTTFRELILSPSSGCHQTGIVQSTFRPDDRSGARLCLALRSREGLIWQHQ